MIAALPLEVTIPELIGALEKGSIFQRVRSIKMLGGFGPRASEAVPALIEALVDERPGVRREAIVTLRKIGPAARAAMPALKTIQGDDRLVSLAKDAMAEIDAK